LRFGNNSTPWDIALETLRAIPNYRTLKLIELGCGDGRMIEALAAEGCSVKGTTYLARERDHIRSREYPDHLSIDSGIDLTASLPYEANSFDAVLCMEVIEHLECHSVIIREIGRVLRPGGLMIMSFPNIGRFVSRFSFAVTGVHLTKERRPSESDALGDIGSFHVHCPDLPFLHWMLWRSDLRIMRLEGTTTRLLSAILATARPVFNLLIGRALRLHQFVDDPATRDLEHWMKSRAFAVGEQLVVVARKLNGTDAATCHRSTESFGDDVTSGRDQMG
jgi:SAM-dependent methyltransferase